MVELIDLKIAMKISTIVAISEQNDAPMLICLAQRPPRYATVL